MEKVNTSGIQLRNPAVDFLRAYAITIVFLVNVFMVGIASLPNGLIVLASPLDHGGLYNIGSIFFQVAPIFFIISGMVNRRKLAEHKITNTNFFRERLQRLSLPLVIFFSFAGVTMAAALIAGTPWGLLDAIAYLIGLPLSFVAAYLLVQSMLPLMVKLHEKSPYAAVITLFFAAVAVDVMRFTLNSYIGLLNIIFVWLLVQQIGFFISDRTLAAGGLFGKILATAASFTAAGVLSYSGVALGTYSSNMMEHVNPPTILIVFIALAHAVGFVAYYPVLTKLMNNSMVRKFVSYVNTHAITIYVLGLPAVLMVSSLGIVWPQIFGLPGTSLWWWMRLTSLILSIGLMFVIIRLVKYFEHGLGGRWNNPAPSYKVLLMAGLLAAFPSLWTVLFGLDLQQMFWSLPMLAASLYLSLGSPEKDKTVF